MVVVMVVMVMMMVMMHLTGHRSGGRLRRGGFLRDGVSRQADRESGGGDKIFDHSEDFLLFETTRRVFKSHHRAPRLNPR